MSGHTPGPWTWIGDAKFGGFCLATEDRGHQYVMDFVRMGWNQAQPRFQVREDGNGLLVPARDLCTFQVGTPGLVGYDAAQADPSVYRYQITGFDHPDARLIAAAPDLLAALKHLTEAADVLAEDANSSMCDPALEQARAAIAKAEGRP